MKITIITVCFNSAETIADTLLSVAEQDYESVEHIVIDGGSHDATLSIIEQTPNRISHLISETDHGIYDAMNKGLNLATGDVIGFLNSDDVYAHRSILSTVMALLKDSQVDACYGDIIFVEAYNPDRVVRYWKAGLYASKRVAQGWMPPHPSFFAKQSAYALSGGFDPSYQLQGDYEMAIRLLEKQKISTIYLPETLVRMRMGGASNASIRNVIKGNIEAYRAARKHGLAITPWFILSKVFSRIPQFFARP